LKARSAIRTPIRSDACLYTRLCGTSCSRAFPVSARSRPKPSPFSEPTDHPVRGRPAHFELVRPCCDLPPAFADGTRMSDETRCVRPTSASHFLNTSTRASWATGISSRLTPRPWPSGLHPWPGDRWTWRFTTPNSLRWASSGWRAAFVPPGAPNRAGPLTPLSHPGFSLALSHEVVYLNAKTASFVPPWRWDALYDPRCLPSVGDIHARAWIGAELVIAVTCVSATIRPSLPLRV